MTAEAKVTDIIDDARNFADESYDSATDLINDAQSAANGVTLLEPRPLNFSTEDVEELDEVLAPDEFTDSYVKPSKSVELRDDIQVVPIPSVPTFPDPPEELDTSGLFQFDRPAADFAGFDGTLPQVETEYDYPDAPEIVDQEPPEIEPGLDLRATPTANIPTYDPDKDVDIPPEPEAQDEQFRIDVANAIPEFRDWVETYADAWINKYAPEYFTAMSELEAAISRGYEGNTAMPDVVETQLFNRGVERAEAQRVQLDAEATERYARRGYRILGPALAGQLARNQETVARSAADVAREVAIERARLEHQHVQFVMQLSSQIRDGLRGQVINYSGLLLNINGQAIEYAQTIANLAIQTYELLIRRAQLQFEHMNVLARVFEAEIKGSMANIEIFRIEMEAAKAKKDAELADVEVWKSRIEGQELRINLYLAELKGINEKLNAEELKVRVFGEQVEAYRAKVQGKTAEFEAYKAAIQGDAELVDAHIAEVRAYEAVVNAARSKTQAEAAQTDAVAGYNRNLTDVFTAELRGYTAEIDAESKRFDASAGAYRNGLEAYRTHIDAQVNELRISYDKEALELRAAVAKLNGDVRTLLAQGQLFEERIKLRANTAMSGADAFGSMASSAVSAQNTMVSLVNETLNGG